MSIYSAAILSHPNRCAKNSLLTNCWPGALLPYATYDRAELNCNRLCPAILFPTLVLKVLSGGNLFDAFLPV